MHNADSAFVYYMKALKGGDAERNQAIYTSLIELAPLTSLDDHLEGSYGDSLARYTELKERMVQPQKIAAIEKEWIQNKMKKTNAKDRSMLYCLFALLLICSTGLYFYLRRKHRKQLTALYQDIKTTQLQRQSVESFYNNIWLPNVERFSHSAHYNIICDLLSEEEKLPEAKQKKIISDLYNEFASSINALSQYTPTSSIGQEDWFYIIMTYLNIPPRTIVRCLPSGTDALRKRKKRIQSKLAPEYFRLFFQGSGRK